MTVDEMIALFYHVRPFQISGGPKWLNVRRFDVTGKDSTVSAASPEFKAKHWSDALDSEDEQMQKLLSDRFGLRLHHETKLLPTLTLVADIKKRRPPSPCSSEYRLQHGVVKGSIHMASLASLLEVEFGMPVRDATGLKECYYFDTHWTTDPDDDSAPYIATALHQLGLNLKKTKGDVDVLVIDHVALPSPD
jgi:uncharacterized protein (TIGR03435 family)